MTSMRRLATFAVWATLISVSAAQNLSGPGQYPHFRGASGLPGGFFGVTYEGRPSMAGAMAIATPVGFSLSNFHAAVGLSNLSRDSQFRMIGFTKDGRNANGTAQVMVGFSTKYGNITVSDMIVSSQLDNVINVLWQVPSTTEGLGVAVGVTDVFETGGSAGVNQPTDGKNRRSVFGVATYQVRPGTHVSLGAGNHRFRGVFGNVSQNVGDRFKLVGEYDTFNWNYGVSWNVGPLRAASNEYDLTEETDSRRGDVFINLGFVRKNHLYYGVTVTF